MGVFIHKRCGVVMHKMEKEDKEANQRTRRNSRKHLKTITGTRNPYALVEHKLGIKIDWRATSPAIAQKFLETTLKIPYNRIFVSGNHSPIFAVPRKRGSVTAS
jgi:hypothetical protein